MRQRSPLKRLPSGAESNHRSIPPLLAWIGWTALWLLVSALLFAIVRAVRPESFGLWFTPVLAALIVGVASHRRSFMLSPVVVGLLLAASLLYASIRYDNTRFAEEAGFIILWFLLAIVVFGSLGASVIGVVIGSALSDWRQRSARTDAERFRHREQAGSVSTHGEGP